MVTFESDGSLTFRVYLPNAESVSLVADFTKWADRAMPLRRELNDQKFASERRLFASADVESLDYELESHRGWWTLALRVTDGDHAFSYLVDDRWWLPDYAAHGVKRNEHGNWTSLLFVPPPPRMVERFELRRAFDHIDRMDPAAGLAESPARLERLRSHHKVA